MGNLLVSMRNAAGAMSVFERAIGVVQANVTNASTPGYAKQQQILEAVRFDLDAGLPGGVASGGTADSRNEYAESSVRRRVSGYGDAAERAQQLEQLEQVFDVADKSGLAGALNDLFDSFSALTVAPNDLSAREIALKRASDLARSFNATASGLQQGLASIDSGLNAQADRINSLTARIADLNREFRGDFRAQSDAGLQAQMNTLLEDLSESVDVSVLRGDDGSATVSLGGQTLLAIGDRQLQIQVDTSASPARLLDNQGHDITNQVSGGRLKALLDLRNVSLPASQSQLDKLAQSLADHVNATLSAGVDMNGAGPSTPLFRYDTATGAARSLAVNPLAPRDLALADPTSPGGNAVALQLSALAQQKTTDGFTFTAYYGVIAAQAGQQLAGAREDLTSQQKMVSQAEQLRGDMQSVNLDEEAVNLLAFQRSYQAAAKMVQTLNEMTDTLLNLLS